MEIRKLLYPDDGRLWNFGKEDRIIIFNKDKYSHPYINKDESFLFVINISEKIKLMDDHIFIKESDFELRREDLIAKNGNKDIVWSEYNEYILIIDKNSFIVTSNIWNENYEYLYTKIDYNEWVVKRLLE